MNTTPPTPTPSSIPTLRLAVDVGYVLGCDDCLRVLELASAAAFRDAQVTSFKAQPGTKHAHDAGRLPASDVNGSAPNDTQTALFAMGPTAGSSDVG